MMKLYCKYKAYKSRRMRVSPTEAYAIISAAMRLRRVLHTMKYNKKK